MDSNSTYPTTANATSTPTATKKPLTILPKKRKSAHGNVKSKCLNFPCSTFSIVPIFPGKVY